MSGLIGVCFLFIALPLAIAFGAACLKVAIWIYNQFAGGQSAKRKSLVPNPPWGNAMGIIAITAIANAIVGFVVNFSLTFIVGMAMGLKTQSEFSLSSFLQIYIGIWLISTAVSLVVNSFAFHKLIPTSLDRAILVTLCYFAICILIAIMFYLAIIVILFLGFAAAGGP